MFRQLTLLALCSTAFSLPRVVDLSGLAPLFGHDAHPSNADVKPAPALEDVG